MHFLPKSQNSGFHWQNDGKEGIFQVTRMRCWRITAIGGADSGSAASSSSQPDSDKKMELAIEYLIAKDTLKWITIITDQAILISMCLQVSYLR